MMQRSRYYYMLPLMAWCTYLFLYIPIIVLVIFSFNKADVPFVWKGFSLHWYSALWQSSEIWQAFFNSLTVAISSVFLSLAMGLLYVFYGSGYMLKLEGLFYTSLATPEIVIAVGLLSMFSFFSVPMGLATLIAGHTLLGLGYVIPIIASRYHELDKQYYEASLDLGASEGQTLRKVMIPLLAPALLAAGLMVFVISMDDFIISFFCAGGSTQTLPMYIFVMIRSGATPIINALSTLLLLGSSLLVLIFSSLQIKKMELLR